MKKIIAAILTIALFASSLVWSTMLFAGAATSASDLVVEKHETFVDGAKYKGKHIASHLDVGEFADFNIVDDGGTHIDGNGNQVYSNYVIFGVNLNFNSSTKEIGNTGVKVSNDKCDWNETPYAAKGDTEQYIAYGAISAKRIDANGNEFKYEPLFSKGNTSVQNMIFNEDGDYEVVVLFESVKNGKYQNHVLSWSFKIRSYVYLVDEQTGFPIKNSGISGKPVVLDLAGRRNVAVTYTYTNERGEAETFDAYDGEKLDRNGTYSFVVKSNGFVCEKFNFYLDMTDPISRVFFANLRKETGKYTYEAESYFYMIWTENEKNPISVSYDYYDYTSTTPVTSDYVAETLLDKVGLYRIKVSVATHLKPIEYVVEVVESDSPWHNYEVLSGERFNNFKTKWYQVYDDINNRFLCFDMSEYDKAYEAAMTIENSSVGTGGGAWYYNGQQYADRIDLTAAMHAYAVEHNILTVYYDPFDYDSSAQSERTFSSNAFDGTMYLDDVFQFAYTHGAESKTISAVDENGKVYDKIEFFVAMADQEPDAQLPHGKYEVTETDMYGNTTTYTAYRDKKAPEISLAALDESVLNAVNGGVYTLRGGFSVSRFFDDYDAYAVLKLEKPDQSVAYYTQGECEGITFTGGGVYRVTAYDRNNNTMSFTVSVS